MDGGRAHRHIARNKAAEEAEKQFDAKVDKSGKRKLGADSAKRKTKKTKRYTPGMSTSRKGLTASY